MTTAPAADSDELGHSQARETALRLLARREHSRDELRRKLEMRGLPGGGIEYELDTLEAEGLLSDERFAEEFVRSKMNAGHGPFRIARDLAMRGVAAEHIENALAFDDTIWVTLAARARNKKYGSEAPDSYQAWTKQAKFLRSRGYTGPQIREALASESHGDC